MDLMIWYDMIAAENRCFTHLASMVADAVQCHIWNRTRCGKKASLADQYELFENIVLSKDARMCKDAQEQHAIREFACCLLRLAGINQ